MTPGRTALALSVAAIVAANCASGRPAPTPPVAPPESPSRAGDADELRADLDGIFDTPALARALMAVRVESLASNDLIYERNADKLVVPASNMKIITVAVAAHRLGWDYRYTTDLDAVGTVTDGTLEGDLVVTGTGDPSIGSPDGGHGALLLQWADTLVQMGIRRIHGRIIGDDNAFDDEPLGAGWAWDYLAAGYAAPSGALNYNENVGVVRTTPGTAIGMPAAIAIAPPGHLLTVANHVTTADRSEALLLDLARLPGGTSLSAKGRIPLGTATVIRTTAVDNPTLFFAEAFRLALVERGITVTGNAVDIDDVRAPAGARVRIASHLSAPLSTLVGYAMKVSQNFYGEILFKTLGRRAGVPGSTEGGRQAIRGTLAEWGIPADSIVPYDGSGLSRYNFTTTKTLVAVLRRAWEDEGLRGPYVASLPVGGHDGTLESRMRNPELDRRVQAKTGTITNVRALSGYVERASGDKLAFSMVANNFTTANAEIDALMEQALARLAR